MGGDRLSRRRWLQAGAVALAAGSASALGAQSPRKTPLTAEEERVVAAIRQKATKAGLGTLEVRWTEHFLGIGDAPPDDYIVPALNRCESFSRDFLEHFRARGFHLEFPRQRMTVLTLKDADSYQAYTGAKRDEAVGGHYDVDSNQLVVFDFRPGQGQLAAGAKRVNTYTLIHETAHMLSYNSGMLPLGRDVPVAISEGIATYAEMWTSPRDRTVFGKVNQPRLKAPDDPDARWIPIARLLVDDNLFDDPKTYDMAYAESWLLFHHLVRQPDKLPKLRAYLAGFPAPGGKPGREAYAASALGSLDDLDAEIRRYARRMRSRAR